jgi:hypothetical protein
MMFGNRAHGLLMGRGRVDPFCHDFALQGRVRESRDKPVRREESEVAQTFFRFPARRIPATPNKVAYDDDRLDLDQRICIGKRSTQTEETPFSALPYIDFIVSDWEG